MDSLESLDYVCQEAARRGAQCLDAVAGESDSVSLEFFEGRVKNTEISSSRGVGMRLFMGSRPGYAFTEKYSLESLGRTVQDAVSNASLTDPLEIELPAPVDMDDIDLEIWNEDLEKVGIDRMKELGLELESIARAADARVENVPYLGVGLTSGKTWLKNSRGLTSFMKANSLYAGIGVLTSKGKSKKMGVYSNGGYSLDEFDPVFMAGEAVKRGIEMLGAHPVKSGQYPVVLSNRVTPQIFSMYGSSFFAEVVQKGQSKLEGRLESRIASELLDITCEPHIKRFPGSRINDGEGVSCRKFKIIEGGFLRNYLYNLESAKKDSRQPTGHAVRGYGGQVGTGFSNMMVRKGDRDLSDLLAAHPKCLYVNNLEGGSGCSAVSGELSIGVQGFWIENGKKIHPVDGVTMGSNFFELIKNIEFLSNRYSDTHSSVKVPDMLIRSMFIAG